jgi:rhamnosyltransferase
MCGPNPGTEKRAESIASVTVAYNGESLLARHLDALLGQSRPLDKIIVVNNASTDGTLRLLAERYPQVTVLDLPTNTGVGGGYASGLSFAMEKKNHDWVWLFDQDSAPGQDCLERLIKGLESLGDRAENVAVLAPVCIHPETGLSYPGLLWRDGWQKPTEESSSPPMWFVDAVISSGTLVRSEAVKLAGLPRADFFIDYVDFEYCLRLRRHGYDIVVVRDSLLHHQVGEPRQVKFAGFSLAWADHVPWREYYLTRNEIFTLRAYCPTWGARFSVARRLLRHGVSILLFGSEKVACLKMIYLGVLDGRAGRLGIRTFAQAGPTLSEPR